MRWTFLLFLLAACPKPPEDVRTIKVVTPVVQQDEGPLLPPRAEPKATWRAGFTNAPPVLRRVEEAWGFTLGGPVTTPVAADATQVYVTAADTVHAFTADGKRVWQTRLPGARGVVATGDTVVAGGEDGRVHFMDRLTGRDVVATERGGSLVGWPVPIDGGWAWLTAEGVVATNSGWLWATGTKPVGRPASDESLVYLVTADRRLLVVGATGVAWEAPLPGPPVDGPALDEDNVYVSVAADQGKPGGVVAFARWGPMTGKQRWRFTSEFQPLAAVGADTRYVYAPDKDGNVYALDVNTGALAWKSEGYGEFTTQPLVTPGSIYVGNSDGRLNRIDTDDGGRVWATNLGSPVTGQPAIVGSRLVVGLANGRIVGLE
jgi:outer membrane protein assembly factor BamB